jgi:hypothetical protein
MASAMVYVRSQRLLCTQCQHVPHFANIGFVHRNSTLAGVHAIAGLNSTLVSYQTVLEEVSKYNVHLNLAEKLWAVCLTITPAQSRH